MKKKEIDQYNMLLAVETHFDINEPIWTSNVPVSDTKTAFSATLDQISATVTLQRNTSTGVTSDKVALRKDLEGKGLFVSSALSAYSSMHPGQGQEFKRLNITKSDFIRFRETDLIAYIEELDTAAMTVVESLEAYGVTPATLTALMAARTAFHNIMNIPEEVTSNRRDATDAIPGLLHQAISMLDNTMDKLMEVFRATQPQFVNVYFNDRKIHSIGTRTLSLEIFTVNAGDNTPLAKAHIEIVGEGIKRISTEKGQNRVQNLKEGNYTLSVSHPNFAPQMIPFTIVSGQTTEIVIEMQGAPSAVPQ